jgi:hypothetical protein
MTRMQVDVVEELAPIGPTSRPRAKVKRTVREPLGLGVGELDAFGPRKQGLGANATDEWATAHRHHPAGLNEIDSGRRRTSEALSRAVTHVFEVASGEIGKNESAISLRQAQRSSRGSRQLKHEARKGELALKSAEPAQPHLRVHGSASHRNLLPSKREMQPLIMRNLGESRLARRCVASGPPLTFDVAPSKDVTWLKQDAMRRATERDRNSPREWHDQLTSRALCTNRTDSRERRPKLPMGGASMTRKSPHRWGDQYCAEMAGRRPIPLNGVNNSHDCHSAQHLDVHPRSQAEGIDETTMR